MAVFVRYVTSDVIVKEELLDLVELKDTTRGVDVKEALKQFRLKPMHLSTSLLVLLQMVHQQWLANMLDLLAY